MLSMKTEIQDGEFGNVKRESIFQSKIQTESPSPKPTEHKAVTMVTMVKKHIIE